MALLHAGAAPQQDVVVPPPAQPAGERPGVAGTLGTQPPAGRCVEDHEVVAKVDQFPRLYPDVTTPNVIRPQDVFAVAGRPAIARLCEAGLDELAVRVVLQLRPKTDGDCIQIAAVVRLESQPNRTPQHRLSEA